MDFIDVINSRRAVNFFDPDKDVSDETLRSIIETAAKVPSSFNLQPWSLIVLRGHEEKMRLQSLAWNQPKVSEAPVTLIILADRDGWKEGHQFVEKNFQEMIKAGSMSEDQRQWFEESRTSLYGENGEQQQAFACKNTGFFAMALMFAAKNLGLDTHPMDGFDHDAVRKEFNIPDNYWIPLLMAVGYFKEGMELAPPKWRKTVEEIIVKFH
ncbi:MAG: nitroreductase family protein [Deltaproteobacteria bacterium]|nr:nitroreductase family protein [Deltaproteobacteria bacterium]MBW2620567.1 nitroreductase family protein [Deltaproteobacteria bacterium]